MKKTKRYLIRASAIFLIGFAAVVTADHDKDNGSQDNSHENVAMDDKQQIRYTINTIYDTPEHKVVIDPVVVQGDHAIASWIQQDKGGRALLHRNSKGIWAIVLCSGKAVKETKILTETGVAPADADALAKGIETAEAEMEKEKIALFDSFKGVMRNTYKPVHHHDHHDHGKDHSHHESAETHTHH